MAACTCVPTFQAWVYDRSLKRKIWRSFPSEVEATAWRRAMHAADRNPLDEIVLLVEQRIDAYESTLGEALPHFYLVRDFVARMHALAESEGETLWKDA